MKLGDSYDGWIAETVFTSDEIAMAIERLACEIAADFRGQPLTLLGVLKGALYFTSDLSRALAARDDGPSEIIVDYLCVSSYGNATSSSGEVRMLKDTSEPIAGRNVLILEDIVDNGLTLRHLRSFLEKRHPASLRACTLFDKPYRRQGEVLLEYVGLPSPDAFVVGYGLDYQEMFRNLPYLAQLRPTAFES
jgi:hypoxanthine phosphoribosyltransferase